MPVIEAANVRRGGGWQSDAASLVLICRSGAVRSEVIPGCPAASAGPGIRVSAPRQSPWLTRPLFRSSIDMSTACCSVGSEPRIRLQPARARGFAPSGRIQATRTTMVSRSASSPATWAPHARSASATSGSSTPRTCSCRIERPTPRRRSASSIDRSLSSHALPRDSRTSRSTPRASSSQINRSRHRRRRRSARAAAPSYRTTTIATARRRSSNQEIRCEPSASYQCSFRIRVGVTPRTADRTVSASDSLMTTAAITYAVWSRPPPGSDSST